ncbi:hypothetical protein GOPIP_087_00500 [Gordonia polyisoprenivorans NBRC 16320 = JCM 10675]|nr:hypothetical protein B1964_21380 [Gordonia sp. i37]OZC33723.1 hypothetical protein CJJ17_21165 [Gordonia polyisoprenivorans]GAB25659.1 hypothetical protein GOPIP_087_00500 [Gordonia polyisoprenivorans NBRC 16320 = JCM 10675]
MVGSPMRCAVLSSVLVTVMSSCSGGDDATGCERESATMTIRRVDRAVVWTGRGMTESLPLAHHSPVTVVRVR